jgi:hypothetical protein
LQKCFVEGRPVPDSIGQRLPAIPGLVVYVRPRPGRSYVIGMDPAEGNPTSNDSALTILDELTGEEAAALAGKFEPTVFASYGFTLAVFFNHAPIMCERNNHGHAVLLWLSSFADGIPRLCGHDSKVGWLSSQLGKVQMYDACADAFKNQEVILHSFATFTQLASIDGSTLLAPSGQNDDRADGFTLAVCGRLKLRTFRTTTEEPIVLTPGKGGVGADRRTGAFFLQDEDGTFFPVPQRAG